MGWLVQLQGNEGWLVQLQGIELAGVVEAAEARARDRAGRQDVEAGAVYRLSEWQQHGDDGHVEQRLQQISKMVWLAKDVLWLAASRWRRGWTRLE